MVANSGKSVVANGDKAIRRVALKYLELSLDALQEAGHDLRQQNTPQGLAMLITGVRVTDDGRYVMADE